MRQPTLHRNKGRSSRAFTLIEALISVAVLLVIILFTSKIFSSVSSVTSAGQANADVMQDAAAIETQIRQDIERLSREGYFAIISRAIRNDVNDPTRAGMTFGTDSRFWLDPNRAPGEYIRSDRLVFFAQGVATGQHFMPTMGDNRKAQTDIARAYYGHGFQLGKFALLAGDNLTDSAGQFDFPPWDIGNNGSVNLDSGNVNGFFQPAAPQWSLARQAVLLGDDGDSVSVYLGQGRSTDSIWNLDIRNSRADVAASRMNDIRRFMLVDPNTNNARLWTNAGGVSQQELIIDSMLHPRAEAVELTASNVDIDKTIHVLGTAVSDFIVEWTYESGTGFTPNPADPNNPFRGVQIGYAGQTPWFGLPDGAFGQIPPEQDRGVFMLDDEVVWLVDSNGPIRADHIEFLTQDYYGDAGTPQLDIWYVATFGYNQNRPLNPSTGAPWAADHPQTYTPWPSALRITMRVHDPRTTIENGREVQFVVDLPKRHE